MKKIASTILILSLLYISGVAHAFDQTLDLERSSSQYAKNDTVSAALQPSGDFTLEIWWRPESDDADQTLFDISDQGGSGQRYGYQLYYRWGQSPQRFQFAVGGGAGGWLVSGNISHDLTISDFQHVAMTFDSSTGVVEVLVDFTSIGTVTGSSGTVNYNGNKFHIGSTNGNFGQVLNFVDGNIGMARVWSDIRTAQELEDNACEELGSATNLEGEWFWTNVATDNTTNGNDLTLVNSPSYSTDLPSTCSATPAEPETPPALIVF